MLASSLHDLQVSDDLEDAQDRAEGLMADMVDSLPRVGIALAIVLVAWGIARVLHHVLKRRFSRSRPPSFTEVVPRLAGWGVVGVGVILGVTIAFSGIDPVDVIAGLGIVSVVAGFAFKDILSNLLSGLLLFLRRRFVAGDQIELGEFQGTVEGITIRETAIITFDGRRVLLPNNDVYQNAISIQTAHDAVRRAARCRRRAPTDRPRAPVGGGPRGRLDRRRLGPSGEGRVGPSARRAPAWRAPRPCPTAPPTASFGVRRPAAVGAVPWSRSAWRGGCSPVLHHDALWVASGLSEPSPALEGVVRAGHAVGGHGGRGHRDALGDAHEGGGRHHDVVGEGAVEVQAGCTLLGAGLGRAGSARAAFPTAVADGDGDRVTERPSANPFRIYVPAPLSDP